MDDRYTCPVCGNHITKRPYPDTREGADPSRKRWGCQFCRSPLDAVFTKTNRGWKFSGFQEAPRMGGCHVQRR